MSLLSVTVSFATSSVSEDAACGIAWCLSVHLPFNLGNVNESHLLLPSIVEELSLGTFLSVRIMYLDRAEAG